MSKSINNYIFNIFLFLVIFACYEFVYAHGVSARDAGFIQKINGQATSIFIYLGAKHMVTGYDHLLYLCGVIFFLKKLNHIVIFVSLFAVGHSITLLWGVISHTHINPFIIDAIIGLSIVYKALENLDEIKNLLHFQIDPKIAVFCFGLIHGLGLASKLQDFIVSENGVVANIISFNIGVEVGQIIALLIAYFIINSWRKYGGFYENARTSNFVLMFLGFLLFLNQISAYYLST